MFLPTTKEEMNKLGWKKLDVILVSGDTYIDSSYSGAAVIGKYLLSKGFKVGIIAQPRVACADDIKRLGEPELFWGVSSGCVDSMVANYTASLKKRKSDDFTPGGLNDRRPDRAIIVYTNLIRQTFKQTVPIVIGGIEASLRRVAHYDYWSDKLRRSILFDAKADYLIYGMGEKASYEMACSFQKGEKPLNVNGICYASSQIIQDYVTLPSFEEVQKNKEKFIEMFHAFFNNNDPVSAKGLMQKHDNRYLIQNPPQPNLSESELDEIYALDFENDAHPFYKKQGSIKALDTIKFSVTTHRGCYGDCNFCAIAVHQGRTVISRSEDSILREIEKMTRQKDFKGIIHDVGGPTSNMYGIECKKKLAKGMCLDKHCIFPEACKGLKINHSRQVELLKRIRGLKNVRKVFVTSGLRYDMIMEDKTAGEIYLDELIEHHVSGQLKIAPEHIADNVLMAMGKPSNRSLEEFKTAFENINRKKKKNQFLTYYFIAAHPGCSNEDMSYLKKYTSDVLHVNPEQVQIFTPTPSTYSTLMYYTEKDPFTGKRMFVERSLKGKTDQKEIIVKKRGEKNVRRRI